MTETVLPAGIGEFKCEVSRDQGASWIVLATDRFAGQYAMPSMEFQFTPNIELGDETGPIYLFREQIWGFEGNLFRMTMRCDGERVMMEWSCLADQRNWRTTKNEKTRD